MSPKKMRKIIRKMTKDGHTLKDIAKYLKRKGVKNRKKNKDYIEAEILYIASCQKYSKKKREQLSDIIGNITGMDLSDRKKLALVKAILESI